MAIPPRPVFQADELPLSREPHMSADQTELVIDLGEVGYRDSKQSFRVRLNASALRTLIEDAANAHRVYELMLIVRPGDAWAYVDVTIEAAPDSVTDRVESARLKQTHEHPWPENSVPFTVFDSLFYWCWDDTLPEDEAWLSHRESPTLHTYAQQFLVMVKTAQDSLDQGDALLSHIVGQMRAGNHAYDYIDRTVAIENGRVHAPNTPSHTADFYRKLGELLQAPDITSVAYRADGDYRVLRMMATEQRRRADMTGQGISEALRLNALVNQKISNAAWGSEIWLYDEGLGHGDLRIEGDGLGENTIKDLIEIYHRINSRQILAAQSQGEISGYSLECGDGWALYNKNAP